MKGLYTVYYIGTSNVAVENIEALTGKHAIRIAAEMVKCSPAYLTAKARPTVFRDVKSKDADVPGLRSLFNF